MMSLSGVVKSTSIYLDPSLFVMGVREIKLPGDTPEETSPERDIF
jgi:hypothetical protein